MGAQGDRRPLDVRENDGVVTLTLDVPERRNALSPALFGALVDEITRLRSSASARVVVLTGRGDAFCAGGDIRDSNGLISMATGSPFRFLEFYRSTIKEAVLGLRELGLPTIAMVNGPAHGAGFDLALACDMRVGSTVASFCAAWVRRALVPAGGTTWLLPPVVGTGRAADIIMTGRVVPAEEAERIGLLNRLVAPEALLEATCQLASSLAEGPPVALALSKRNLYEGAHLPGRVALDMLAAHQVTALHSRDFREGIDSFLESRKPMFTGE